MREPSILRRAALAGALALSLTGITAAVDGAQAMPASAALARPFDGGSVTAVQYQRYPNYRYRRFNRNAAPASTAAARAA